MQKIDFWKLYICIHIHIMKLYVICILFLQINKWYIYIYIYITFAIESNVAFFIYVSEISLKMIDTYCI